jgi:hypothetical protein
MNYVSVNKNLIKTSFDNSSSSYMPKNNWNDLIEIVEMSAININE